MKTYLDKNELVIEGCNVVDSWKELVLFRSMTVNTYESSYFQPCHLPYRVTQILKDYFYEKKSGKKSRRWFEARVERRILESLDGASQSRVFSMDLLEDESILNLLGSCLDGNDDAVSSGATNLSSQVQKGKG